MRIYLRAVVFSVLAVALLVSTCVIDSRATRGAPPNIFQFK